MPSHLTKLIHVCLNKELSAGGQECPAPPQAEAKQPQLVRWPLTSNKRARHFSVLSRNPSTQVMVSCLPALLSPPH